MKYNKETMTISDFLKHHKDDRLNFDPYYQRGVAWSEDKQKLAIDSILRGYDFPKFYARKIDGITYEIIDGKQRGTSIVNYFNGEFGLPSGSLLGDEVIASKTFEALSSDLKAVFLNYALDFTVYNEISNEETEQIFVRLQNGAPLNIAEKRFASSKPIIGFIRDIAQHEFFSEKLPIKNTRGTYRQIATQLFAANIAKDYISITSPALTRFITNNSDIAFDTNEAADFVENLDTLSSQFTAESENLIRPNLVPLIYLLKHFKKRLDFSEHLPHIQPWLASFTAEKREQQKLPESKKSARWNTFLKASANHTDQSDSIKTRSMFMINHFENYIGNL